jgi:2-polyprenyl-3-methyl-5-hydroxy-6-metoxy-1,4-benzoquinol methylase
MPLTATATATSQLTSLYGEMTSLDRVRRALARDGVDVEHLQARDLYERDLDCQNLGGFGMLEVIATTVAGRAALQPDDHLLDVGCGMGGPGRVLADRYGCTVTGIDVLPLRVESAEELTKLTGLEERISYRLASATDLPFENGAFTQVWLLDVGIHVRDKRALFLEIARVLRPGGLLVMHDQTGPLPKAMAPATRNAPFIAPSLPQLIRYVEAAGLRLTTWQDSTARIVAYFQQVKARLGPPDARPDQGAHPWREWIRTTADAYLATLDNLGGRTGIMIAERQHTS